MRIAYVLLAWFGLVGAHWGSPHVGEPTAQPQERVHLPTECRQYYGDGTTRWIDCMGVGYK